MKVKIEKCDLCNRTLQSGNDPFERMESKVGEGNHVLVLTHNDSNTALVAGLPVVLGSKGKLQQVACDALAKSNIDSSSLDTAFYGFLDEKNILPKECLLEVIRVLKPNGRLWIKKRPETDCSVQKLISSLKLSGFVKINETLNEIEASRPSYEIGSSVKLNFTQKESSSSSAQIWQLAAEEELEGKESELIDESELLDANDLKKPDPSSLRVCGTTNKRKACANCTCGLAEELTKAEINEIKQNTQNAKSSCGSCYLGDAFRCADCPYMGLPAFKPGEKVVIDNTDDV